MKCGQRRFAMRALAGAVQGALASLAFLPAMAADGLGPVTAVPDNSVEVGALYVDEDSQKFGEFSGLDRKGTYINANVRASGGDGDASAFRWSLFGTSLGLDGRRLGAEAGVQGNWRITGGYDEIVRNFSDTYSTLWYGLGTTTLTLPPGYPAASTRLSSTGTVGGILSNWNNIQAPNATATSTGGGPGYVIPANMHGFDLGTKRKIGNVEVSKIVAPGWQLTAGVRHEEKEGTKITGVNIGRFAGVSALLPEPIDSTTDIFNAAISFADPVKNFSIGYTGSIYRNDVKLWTVENAGANNAVFNNVARLQSYPDNQMHQLNVSGGYRFSPTARLQASGSWSRLTQDDTFIDAPAGSNWVIPENSAHAKVINTFFMARLTTQPMRNLSVNASVRYDERKNKTPIEEFLVTAGDAPGATTLFENEPINRRLENFALEGEYRIARGQAVRAEYQRENIKRWSSAHESPFRAENTYEDTVRFEFRNNFSDTLQGRISYAYSERRHSEYEEGDPLPQNPPAPLPAADPFLPGFEHFFLAERNRNKLRSQVTWQASDTLAVQGSLDYNKDKYKPEFGVKESRSWIGTVDASVAASDRLTFSAFYSFEDLRNELESRTIGRATISAAGVPPTFVPHVSGPPCAPFTNQSGRLPEDYYTDPCRQWTQTQGDKIHTVGLSARYRGLMAGRLDVGADVAYSQARTPISVTGGAYFGTGVPSSATGNQFIPAESFSDITTRFTQLRLSGTYAIDKKSSVRVQYIYGRLKSSDWAYDAYANSLLGVLAVQNYVGPGMTSPNYDVNVIGISYIYRFR